MVGNHHFHPFKNRLFRLPGSKHWVFFPPLAPKWKLTISTITSSKSIKVMKKVIPYHPWDWYIYLHFTIKINQLWVNMWVNIHKYTIHGWYGHGMPPRNLHHVTRRFFSDTFLWAAGKDRGCLQFNRDSGSRVRTDSTIPSRYLFTVASCCFRTKQSASMS